MLRGNARKCFLFHMALNCNTGLTPLFGEYNQVTLYLRPSQCIFFVTYLEIYNNQILTNLTIVS
jgi:hypothetical protein